MKRLLCLALTFVFCIGLISAPVSADDYVAYKVNIIDNGDGTVTVTAYIPANICSGRLVLSTTADLTYVSGSVPSICTFNEAYNKNGITGICISFASARALPEDTLVYTGQYSVTDGATIGVDDVYSYEWNLTNGDSYVGNQNNGGVDVTLSVRTYTVKFYGSEGQLLKEEYVSAGGFATAPEAPSVEGYDFIGWDKEFATVTSDMEITAQYSIKMFTITFVVHNDYKDDITIIGDTTAIVPYGTPFDDLPFPECEIKPGSDGWFDLIHWYPTSGYHSNMTVVEDLTVAAKFAIIVGPGLPDDDYTLGDVNCDGYVDNIDASIILKYDAGLIDIDNAIQFAGDVNLDGYVDNIDAAMILKYDAGIIEGF